MSATLTEIGLAPEYAVIRDARTLGPVSAATRETRALIAARVGAVRLIDNAPWLTGPLA
jgi:pantothenate synthetase